MLDVKVGSGAFMSNEADATKLADTMIAIGEKMGKKVVALLTRMDAPLGVMVGNALEEESISPSWWWSVGDSCPRLHWLKDTRSRRVARIGNHTIG